MNRKPTHQENRGPAPSAGPAHSALWAVGDDAAPYLVGIMTGPRLITTAAD
jgi:hypothetical protein